LRSIDIKDRTTVEVWHGPRILIEHGNELALLKLPTGAITMSVTNEKAASLKFGSANSTSVAITGNARQIRAIKDAIVGMELKAGMEKHVVSP